jgi:hypothetical protein
MTLQLDHILLGVPDLDAGAIAFARLTGVKPVIGGSHPGFGTRNQLVALGATVFFELIAPDPAQPERGAGRAAEIAAMPHPALLTFAMQTTDMNAACAAAERAGLQIGRRDAMSRTRPDGVRLDWTVAHFVHPGYAGAIPFAIDWQGSPHPATTTPTGCVIRNFTVLQPDPAPLAHIYAALGIDIPVRGGLRPGFVLTLDTPNGEVVLL